MADPNKAAEHQLRLIGSSKNAQIALNALKPFLDEERLKQFNLLKQQCREGKYDHLTMVARLSAAFALDDIEERMIRQIRIGREEEEKLLKGAPGR